MSIIFYGVLGILILVYLFQLYVSILNFRYRKTPIAENIKDIYDEERYQKWLNYSLDTHKFSIIKKGFSLGVILLLLIFNVFGLLVTFTNLLSDAQLLSNLFFLGIYMIFQIIISIPFDYYHDFVLEEKYGFNQTTKKTFIADIIRNIVLVIVLGGGVVSLLYIPFNLFRDNIWLFTLFTWLGALFVVFVLIAALNKLLVRIFNKLTPLPEGSLRDRIESLAKEVGFNLKALYVMDASKRSTKLNAFFSGMGKMKEVVLFDTLIDKMNEDEIVAVLAHELGHAVHKDTLRMFFQQAILFGVFAALFGFIFQGDLLFAAFGISEIHFGFGLILFVILVAPFNLLFGIPLSYLSRKAEYKADQFAVKLTSKASMISALKVLSREVLSNLTPHPLAVILYYSHPPMKERVAAIEGLSS
jgi:STE24 endopeptidase